MNKLFKDTNINIILFHNLNNNCSSLGLRNFLGHPGHKHFIRHCSKHGNMLVIA